MRLSILSLLGLTLISACTPEETEKEDSGSEEDTGTVDDTGTDTGTDTDTDTGEPPVGEARVRVTHLSPDAPAVDVFIDGVADPVVSGLAFPTGTGFLDVPEGTYTFHVAPADAGVDAAVLTIADVTLTDGMDLTAVAFDNVANIQAAAIVEDVDGLGAGEMRLNVMHGAPGVGEVDIWVLGDAPAMLLADVPFGASAVLDLSVGGYPIGFDVDNDAMPDLTFTVPELPAGAWYNLYATNDAAGNVFVVGQLPDGSTVRIDPDPVIPMSYIRVLHLSPDAPAVDIWVDGIDTPVASNVSFGEGSGYLSVPEGAYTFRVSPAGTDPASAVLVIEDLALAGGASYTAVAIDNLAEITALALLDDADGLADGNYRAQVVHAAAAVGEVDIWEITGEPLPLLVDVGFGASAVLDLPQSAYTLGFDVDNDAVPDLSFGVPELAAGSVVNVFATNDAAGSVYLLAQLEDGSLVQLNPI